MAATVPGSGQGQPPQIGGPAALYRLTGLSVRRSGAVLTSRHRSLLAGLAGPASAKAHHPAGNVQALSAPGGVPLWVSDVLPGSTHDLGAGAGVHVPVRKPARSELDTDTKTRNALLRSLRYQGERGFALVPQRWRALQRVKLAGGGSLMGPTPRAPGREDRPMVGQS